MAHIQIGDISPRIQYTGDGAQTVFTYPFPVFKDIDIEVYQDAVLKSPGTDYTVSGAGNSGGGSITFITAPASGAMITIRRNIAVKRTSDFQVSGEFRADVINDELDYQTAALQQIEADISRSLRLGPTDSGTTTLPDKAARSGKYLGFDANGEPMVTDARGPVGPQGPAGNMDGANNLSELTSPPTARTNLGLGSAALENVSAGGTGGLLRADGDGSSLTGIAGGATTAERSNIMLNAFRIEVNGGLAVQNMVDGIADTFTDQTGIDTAGSTNATYDATNNLFSNASPATITYLGRSTDGTAGTSRTFAGQTLGTGDIIVIAGAQLTDQLYPVNSVVVDGVTATKIAERQANGTSGGANTSIWLATGITNATGTITVGFGASDSTTVGIDVYLIQNFASTATATAVGNVYGGTTPSSNINVPANGVLIAGSYASAGGTSSATWSGVAEDVDTAINAGQTLSSGHTVYSAARTGMAISVTRGSTYQSMVAASFAAAATGGSNMTLISKAATALSTPTSAFIVIEEEDVDTVTLNTDLKVYASRDGGTTWTAGTLAVGTSIVTPGTPNTLVPASTGTIIGNFTTRQSAAFDGTTSQSQTAGAQQVVSAYVGKDWGAGNTKAITKMSVYTVTDNNLVDLGTLGIALEGSATGAWAGEEVTIQTFTTPSNTAGAVNTETITNTATAYRYHRCLITSTNSSATTRLAEVQFYADEPPATSRILTATVDLSAQPAGTSMKYKIETLNAKSLKVHSAALQWS